jgi:hypothetical protein
MVTPITKDSTSSLIGDVISLVDADRKGSEGTVLASLIRINKARLNKDLVLHEAWCNELFLV